MVHLSKNGFPFEFWWNHPILKGLFINKIDVKENAIFGFCSEKSESNPLETFKSLKNLFKLPLG